MSPFSLLAFLATCVPQVHTMSSSATLSPPVCTSPSTSQPNPIANDYTGVGVGTGTSNGTLAVIPIDYGTARGIVPAQYPILKDTYRQLFPTLAADMYPVRCPVWRHHQHANRNQDSSRVLTRYLSQMYIEMVQDHDLREDGAPAAPDFSVRLSPSFPP